MDDKAIFNVARAIDSANDRRAYLLESCQDLDQRDRVAALLSGFERDSRLPPVR